MTYDDKHQTLEIGEADARMTYHAPSKAGIDRHAELSAIFANVMRAVDHIVPVGREKALVFTKLEEAKMWASAGVARNKETV